MWNDYARVIYESKKNRKGKERERKQKHFTFVILLPYFFLVYFLNLLPPLDVCVDIGEKG